MRNVFERMKRPFSKVASLSRTRRRSLLIGSLGAAGISCVVGLILITVLELGLGKSISCWVWDECYTEESSADGSGRTAQVSTLPTILGGGQSASSSTPQQQQGIGPSSPQQQPRGGGSSSSGAPQEAPWQASPEEVPGSESPQSSSSAQPGQRQGPSGPVGEDQQQVPSRSNPADQQQPSSAGDSEGSGSQ